MRQDRIGLLFLTPALIAVVVFYLLPVVMTAVFAFTNMSTATGIRGGDWMLTEDGVRDLREAGLSGETLTLIEGAGYAVDEDGLAALEAAFGAPLADRVRAALGGEVFP